MTATRTLKTLAELDLVLDRLAQDPEGFAAKAKRRAQDWNRKDYDLELRDASTWKDAEPKNSADRDGRVASIEEQLRAEIAAIDFELTSCEASIDALGPLLAKSAARRADRRKRDAALAIAELRLDEVASGLGDAGIENLEERLDLRSARATEPELDAGGHVVIVLRPTN